MNQDMVSARKTADCKQNQRELILRGHGMMALAHVGVLKAFAAYDFKLDRVTGLSLGSLVAVLHANGWSPSDMLELFLSQREQPFVRDAWLGSSKCWQPGLAHAQNTLPVAKAFVEAHKLQPKDGLRIVCFDELSKRTVIYAGTDYDLAVALSAACAVAGVMRPVRIGGKVLVDCALNGCRLDDICHQTIVSSARCEDDLSNVKLSEVDRLLHIRKSLFRPAAACAKTSTCVTIETVMPAAALGECSCSSETIAAIVKAGSDAALIKLSQLSESEKSNHAAQPA